jgi:hypothetical protein
MSKQIQDILVAPNELGKYLFFELMELDNHLSLEPSMTGVPLQHE